PIGTDPDPYSPLHSLGARLTLRLHDDACGAVRERARATNPLHRARSTPNRSAILRTPGLPGVARASDARGVYPRSWLAQAPQTQWDVVPTPGSRHGIEREPCGDVTLSRLSTQGGLIMTERRRSATTRSVPAESPDRLLELTQEHIRPLIGLIDRL